MRAFIICLSIIIAMAAFILIQPDSARTDAKHSYGMPWQINIDQGQTTVFGLSPGSSTLQNAVNTLKTEHELAVLAKPKALGAVELFFSHFRTGPLQGKLIVAAEAPEAVILAIKAAPATQEYLDNGTKKYTLTADQTATAMGLTIKSLTLAPSARLDEALINDRFGKPTKTIQINEQVTHYLYDDSGLAIRIDKKGKDMLHYTSPAAMGAIALQLRSEAQAAPEQP